MNLGFDSEWQLYKTNEEKLCVYFSFIKYT